MTLKIKELNNKFDAHRICIAPMIDYTDRHFRSFLRLISRHVYLYTEMISAQAIINGDREKLLGFSKNELPLALQLGDSCPKRLAEAAKISEEYAYSEINLNVGCPSARVQAGRFGACLMKEPELVGECVQAIQAVVSVPVTVKTRIGIDRNDSYSFFYDFVKTVKASGCNTFIIHARKAWLKGLSPKENRTIPELKYDFVKRLKQDFPELEIIVNGGIKDLDINKQFDYLDGIMVGREAYHNPFHLLTADKIIKGKEKRVSRKWLLFEFADYVEEQLARGIRLSYLTRHLLGLSYSIPGGSHWRREVVERVRKSNSFSDYLSFAEHFPE